MIQTNKNVYPNRLGKMLPVCVEIVTITDDFQNNKYNYVIADYIVDNEQKIELGRKLISLSYAQRDGLKKAICLGIPDEVLENLTESEISKLILPHSLLYFVKNDVVDVENNKLIYGTIHEDWELIPQK